MAGLRDEVELDVAAALRDIDRLGASLTQQTQKFRKELASSLDTLRVGPKFDTTGLDRARKTTQGLVGDQERLERATRGTTAATGKYGAVLQSVAQIRVVQGLIAFFGGRALVSQITKTVDAASNLNEEITRSQQVFGDSQGAVAAFSDTAVRSVALARGEALRFANDFGNMFRGAGIAERQAAELSQTFVALGADIASFSNLTIDDALTKLSAGLAGEIEPLRRIGFGFNDLEVQAKATALGLRDANGELSEGAKLQARIAVILEKTKLAQGDLARTSEGLANQQRFLKAEAQELREELGAQLTPVFLELVHSLRENLPAFGELASNAIPLLISALHVLNPAGQILLQLLVALSPILTLVATILDGIPAPVLQLAGAFLLVNRLTGSLSGGLDRVAIGLFNMAGGLDKLAAKGGIAAALSNINPIAVGATIAVIGLTSVLAKHRAEQEKNKRAIQEATQAFLDQADAVDVDAKKIAEGILKDTGIGPDLTGRLVRDLGLNIEEFVTLAAKGGQGYLELLNIIRNSGLSRKDQVFAEREFGEAIRTTSSRLNDAARGALDLAIARGNLSKADVEAAESANKFGEIAGTSMFKVLEGTTNYFGALQDLDPALAAAVAGQESFGGASSETATALDELDDALGKVKDALDATFGRFLDAEEATIRLRSSARELAEALGEGARKGESMVDFQERLRSSTLDVARAVEARALAMARAGQIEATEVGVQAEMRRQLQELVALFPELSGQLQGYIDKLGEVPPTVKTEAQFDDSKARTRAGGWFGWLRRWGSWGGWSDAGNDAATGIADGIDANLGEVADSGREAGRVAAEEAVKEVESTLRRSGRSGLDIGGFIVEGIQLGARQAEVDLHNFLNGMTAGLQGIVANAMKIDQAEASEILGAVENMDQAARDLAEAREKLGADSIEAKLAELELADAQKAVNDAVAEAIDSTEEYQEALDKVTDSIDTMTGSLRALQSLRDAQKAAREAGEDAADEAERLGMFDRLITTTTTQLAEARARRQATGSATPSLEEQRLEAALGDLRARRGEQAEVLADAEGELQDAQLDLIDSQQQLVELGGKVAEAQGVWEGYFRALATQAGLTKAEVDALVASLNVAGSAAQAMRTGVLTGEAQAVNLPATIGTANIGAATFQAASQKVVNNTFNIYEAGSARSTAVEVVDEIRAVELIG